MGKGRVLTEGESRDKGNNVRIIKLMPKANEDLEGIWYYSYHHFGEPQADRYVEHLSDVLQILSNNNIGTPRPELGEGIFVLPFERHVIYFLQSPGNYRHSYP
ncbi:type II toxin-antitoxin system RelE/ParE family toxin [Escherichia coli]|nr:type II toxin-antitoxin system RelE/ParE family toxin [Escherichia coli]